MHKLTYKFPDGSKVPVEISTSEAKKLGWIHGTLFEKIPKEEFLYVQIQWTSKNEVRHTAHLPAQGLSIR